MIRHALTLLFVTPALAACAATGSPQTAASFPEAHPFNPLLDAHAAVDAALAKARDENRLVLLTLGANWCHDSRAFAGWLETPRFAALVEERYVPVYVDVGIPQMGDGFNLDIATRFGMDPPEGTPTVLVLTGEGEMLNTPEDAEGWRNASMRSEEEILGWLESWTAASR